MTIDIKFTQDASSEWDINFENGDFEMTDGLDTALNLSVFGEKRAATSQVAEPSLRRGHFTNDFSSVEGYEVGSLLWLYIEQAKNTQSNLSLIESTIIEGLKWMIEDGVITENSVVTSKSGSQINVEIELKNNRESKYFNLYLNT